MIGAREEAGNRRQDERAGWINCRITFNGITHKPLASDVSPALQGPALSDARDHGQPSLTVSFGMKKGMARISKPGRLRMIVQISASKFAMTMTAPSGWMPSWNGKRWWTFCRRAAYFARHRGGQAG